MRIWKVKLARSQKDAVRFSTSVLGRGSHKPVRIRTVKLMAASPEHIREKIKDDFSQYGWEIVSIVP